MTSHPLPNAPRLNLSVTQEIIDDSCVADSSHCMIADALREAAPWARNISVDIQTIRLSDPRRGYRFVYLTPRIGQLALVDFDAGVKPEPFQFQLRPAQAHVTLMKRAPTGARKPGFSEEQRAATSANLAKARSFNPKETDSTTPATVAVPNGGRGAQGNTALTVRPGGDHDVAVRTGGKTAPHAALAHGGSVRPRKGDGDIPTARRRSFGLRGLDRNRTVGAS